MFCQTPLGEVCAHSPDPGRFGSESGPLTTLWPPLHPVFLNMMSSYIGDFVLNVNLIYIHLKKRKMKKSITMLKIR